MLYQIKKWEIPKAGEVLMDAFQQDLLWKKFFEGETNFSQKMQWCFETPIRFCFKFGKVWAASENFEGVAAWLPGDQSFMTIWTMIRSGAIFSGMKLGVTLGKKMSLVFGPIEDDRKRNMDGEPFVYLFIIGVATEKQGQGFGGKLLHELMDSCDASATAIYLETETKQNVQFYEKHGFRIIKQINLPIVNHPMWEMVRKPCVSR